MVSSRHTRYDSDLGSMHAILKHDVDRKSGVAASKVVGRFHAIGKRHSEARDHCHARLDACPRQPTTRSLEQDPRQRERKICNEHTHTHTHHDIYKRRAHADDTRESATRVYGWMFDPWHLWP